MKRGLLVLALAGSTFLGSLAMAQEQPRRDGDNRESREGREGRRGGRFDPAQARQQMNDRLKEQLKPTEEEWAVLQPLIDRVNNAQRAARTWGGGGFAGRGGDRERQADRDESELQRASRELRTAIQEGSASEATVQEKLAAYRAAREKAQAELNAARKELSELVTPRQEAVLVMWGLLE